MGRQASYKDDCCLTVPRKRHSYCSAVHLLSPFRRGEAESRLPSSNNKPHPKSDMYAGKFTVFYVIAALAALGESPTTFSGTNPLIAVYTQLQRHLYLWLPLPQKQGWQILTLSLSVFLILVWSQLI